MGQSRSPNKLILASLAEAGYRIVRREVGPWIVLRAIPSDGGNPLDAAARDENMAVADLMSAASRAALAAGLASMARGNLPAQTWALIQASVPIVCIDLAPLALGPDGGLERIGLIRRQVPEAGERWALVGGRLWHNETMAAGLIRQVRETLGERARISLPATLRPLVLAEYAQGQLPDRPFDPRQHAIGLTFALEIRGRIRPSGEATGFRWFAPDALPDRFEFGFNQGLVLADLLEAIKEPGAAHRLRTS